MSSYADSGLLASLYLEESTSQVATDTVQEQSSKILITWLTKLEVENAFHRAAFRGKITRDEARTLIAQFHDNIRTAAYEQVMPDPEALYIQASRLADLYTADQGTRTLDLLHVACALMFESSDFLSLDRRQRAVASALGMNVLPALIP